MYNLKNLAILVYFSGLSQTLNSYIFSNVIEIRQASLNSFVCIVCSTYHCSRWTVIIFLCLKLDFRTYSQTFNCFWVGSVIIAEPPYRTITLRPMLNTVVNCALHSGLSRHFQYLTLPLPSEPSSRNFQDVRRWY